MLPIIGALASLVTTGYITLVNLGIKFFAQPTLILSNINFWPLILLGTTGVFVGLLIKFFGQRGGVGVAQSQYVQTGGLNYRNVPSILLQGFIALWGGASIGPEGTLTFLAGGLGTFVSERLKLQKDDVQSTNLQCHRRSIWWFLWLSDSWGSGCSRGTCSSRS